MLVNIVKDRKYVIKVRVHYNFSPQTLEFRTRGELLAYLQTVEPSNIISLEQIKTYDIVEEDNE